MQLFKFLLRLMTFWFLIPHIAYWCQCACREVILMQFQLPRMEISCKESCRVKRVPLCRNIAGGYRELQGRSQWPVFGSLCSRLVGTVILCYYSLEFTTLKLQIPHVLFPASCSADRSHRAPSSRTFLYTVTCFKAEETGKEQLIDFPGRKKRISFFHAQENILTWDWGRPLHDSTLALLCSRAYIHTHTR